MKKLLLIMVAVFAVFAMPMALAESLNGFDITVDTDPVVYDEDCELTITALNETNQTYTGFNQTVNIDWGIGSDTLILTSGVGTYEINRAPKGAFTITVEFNGTNTTKDSFGNYNEITILTIPSLNIEENQTGSFVFDIQNTGTIPLNDIDFEYIGDGISHFNIVPDTLAVDQIKPVELQINSFGLVIGGPYSGIVYVEADGIYNAPESEDQANLTFNVVEQEEEKLLYIDEVEINGERLKLSEYENGDDLELESKDVFGEDLEIIVIIKNDDSTQDMDDVELDVEIEEIDDEDDWDDNEDIGTIKDGDEEEITFTSSIDWTADEDTFQVTITVVGEGEDDNIEYEDEWTFDLKIEKEDDDIAITEAEFDYDSVEAGETAYLTIELSNIGSDDQDEVVLTVECDDLDIDFKELNIDLDEGDTWEITIPIKVDGDVNDKDYNIEIVTYYDYDEYMDEDPIDIDQVTLSVVETEEEDEEEETSYPEYSQPDVVLPEETGFEPQPIPTTTEISFKETTGYTLLLILGNVLLVILIIFLLIKVLM
ncbi:MAG: hypothetical protein KAQ83_01985 [Nanoarchaeota archaeon]|nr:hypothetical protein [Nanoarchaeota archaeon]